MPEIVIENELESHFEKLVRILSNALSRSPDTPLFSDDVMRRLKSLRARDWEKLESENVQEQARALAEAIIADEERQRRLSQTQFVMELRA